MTMGGLTNALGSIDTTIQNNGGSKLDLLSFDSCLMSSIEVAATVALTPTP